MKHYWTTGIVKDFRSLGNGKKVCVVHSPVAGRVFGNAGKVFPKDTIVRFTVKEINSMKLVSGIMPY